jgi:predicted DNA-binding transcriptional regulator AlpA
MTLKFNISERSRNLPTRAVCSRYGVCSRTVYRWVHGERLNFPAPISINGRLYFDEASLIAWERNRACGPIRRGTDEVA